MAISIYRTPLWSLKKIPYFRFSNTFHVHSIHVFVVFAYLHQLQTIWTLIIWFNHNIIFIILVFFFKKFDLNMNLIILQRLIKVCLDLQVLSLFRTLYWSSLEVCLCSSWSARWDSLWACQGSGPGLYVPCSRVSNQLLLYLSFICNTIKYEIMD